MNTGNKMGATGMSDSKDSPLSLLGSLPRSVSKYFRGLGDNFDV
jgi:hypothetical protein